jgi:hypothetical protein
VTRERLVVFLYILMRDFVTPVTVARVLKEHVEVGGDACSVYTNKHLEAYAREVAARLEDPSAK